MRLLASALFLLFKSGVGVKLRNLRSQNLVWDLSNLTPTPYPK